MPQMATASGAEFTGPAWELEELIQWFDHYTSENCFEGGGSGRAPLLFEAFRPCTPLDICRAATKQVQGPQSAAWLMPVLVTHTGWFMEPMGHGARATFVDRVQAPEKFHLAMKSLMAMNPSITSPGSRRTMVSTTWSRYAPLLGACGHGCGTPYFEYECLECTIMKLAVPRNCRRYSHDPRVVADEREPEGPPPMLPIRIPHGPDMCLFKYDKLAVPRDCRHISHDPRVVAEEADKDDKLAVPRDCRRISHDPRVVAEEEGKDDKLVAPRGCRSRQISHDPRVVAEEDDKDGKLAAPRDCRQVSQDPRVVAEEEDPEGPPPMLPSRAPQGPDHEYDVLAIPRDCQAYSHDPRVVVDEEEPVAPPLVLPIRTPQGPAICVCRQATKDVAIDEAARREPIVTVQQHFEDKIIVPDPSCPMVDMALVNVCLRGTRSTIPASGEEVGQGFTLEVFTLPLPLVRPQVVRGT